MAYSNFTTGEVKLAFGLRDEVGHLFPEARPVEPNQWLQDALARGGRLALASSNEKARSEFIVAPILVEVVATNEYAFALFSGQSLDVDEERGLKGECDFILSKGTGALTIDAPVVALVEAKNEDIKAGLGQCIAQMVAARLFNETKGNAIETIHGCVTTGETWQFLKLQGSIITVDVGRYYLGELPRILGVFQAMIDFYQQCE
uniref:Uncharacterized protein n=1 Tax=Candidatus Kentrum sp. MB TaxID=2138164 RepID=A0A450XKM1_9GAMM|nr:MAG: hypothetical protein BECKMB1821G_GA0114241_101538 [Candidatus Kentron sp. MB]VFK29698.1 MAG: hypothetical protein BECKMB1821I_GA0114274_101137 [Candidatus Kentron sp. MB]VFK74874.1 MAG: hypothetical protein BECKMB1821H_GA0114242_101137 [Candidatus Kentron sp. MB]